MMAESNLQNEAESIKRVNRFVLVIITIIDSFLFFGYIGDYSQGNISFSFMLMVDIAVIISIGVCYTIYFRKKDSTLFKYISYLEELYRAVILDNYVVDVRQKFWIKDLREQLKAYSNNLNDALEHIDFSALLIQCQRLPKEVRSLCGFPNIKHLKDNSISLKELRNAVMHNKFLLLYRGYDICYVDGVDDGKSASLKANILNLIQFLPMEVGEQCVKDINACKEDRNETDDTKWDLPSQIVITIDA